MQPDKMPRLQGTTLHLPVAVIAFVISIFFVGATLITHNGDWDAFAMLGTRFSQGDPDGSTGYDGQFFYYIAQHGAAARPLIDGPSLRYMRIGYPLLAGLLSFGQAHLVPYTLVLVNIGAITLGSGLLAGLLKQRGSAPYWALLYTLWPGVIESLRLDLAEPLCVALALAALAAYRRDRHWQAVMWLVLSALTKEIGLVIAGGLALYELARYRWRRGLMFGLIPSAVWAAWLLLLRAWVGRLPVGYPAVHLEIPLAGWLKIEDFPHFVQTGIWLVIPTVLLLGLALWQIQRQRALTLDAALVLTAAGFTLTMPDVSWFDVVAAYRISVFIVVTGLLLLSRYRRLRLYIAALWGTSALLAPLIPGLFFRF